MKHLDKAWLYFSTSHSQFKYFPAVWTSSLSCRVVFTWWIVLPINCGIFQSLRSAKWLSDASSASAQLPGFYWLSVPVICGFCSLALILTNETLNDSSFKTWVWGQQLLRFLLEAPSTLISLNVWNQVSRAARRAAASARVETLATPKELSKDYIPPREPAWSRKNVQPSSWASLDITTKSVLIQFVSFGKPALR